MQLRPRKSLADEIPWPRPRRRRRRVAGFAALVIAAAAAALVIGSAGASVRSAGSSNGLLWATINICGPRHQHHLGIRGQMPGNGTSQQMWMRFRAQYRSHGHWHTLRGGVSRWQYAGSARVRTAQNGRTFTLTLPKRSAYLLRGVVGFEWRNGTHVVKRASVLTTKGHGGTKGSRPHGYSAAFCRLHGK
jgi:hypothetical protein